MLRNTLIIIFVLLFAPGKSQTWKKVSSGTDLPVLTLEADTNNNILYAGGIFASAGSTMAPGIAQWNGSAWTPVGPALFSGTAITAIFSDGPDLYAGGTFSGIGGVLSNNIAQYNGISWIQLDSGLGIAGVSSVKTICKYNGELYAGGTFVNAGFVPLSNIAKWTGSAWISVGGGINGPVYSLEVYNGELYAGGSFTQAGSTPVKNIAKWNGSGWTDPGGGLEYTGATTVSTLRMYKGSLYAGGTFDTAGGTVPVKHVAKWDGATWTDPGGGVDYTGATTVSTLRTYKNKLIVGGTFSVAGSTPANFVASWDDANWSPMGAGMNSSVFSLAVVGDTLYAGGIFTMADNDTAMFVAQWHAPAQPVIGINESYEGAQFKVFPNPCSSILCVNAQGEKNFSFVITDVCGKVVMRKTNCSGAVFVDVRSLAGGVYHCSLFTDRGEMKHGGKVVIAK